jgi:hypothetical protein
MRTVKKLTLAKHLLRRPTNGLGIMNAVFYIVITNMFWPPVAIFRVVRTRIQIQL